MTAVSNPSRVSSETIRARRSSAVDSAGPGINADYTGGLDGQNVDVNGHFMQNGGIGITAHNEIHNHNSNIHSQLQPLPTPIQSFPTRKLSIPPLPRTLSTDTRQAAIAAMQARQETWNRSAARSSTSSDSAASHHSGLSTASNGSHSIASSSPPSPIHVTGGGGDGRAGPSGASSSSINQRGELSTGLKPLKPSGTGQSGKNGSGSGSGSGSGKNPSTGKEVKTRTRKKVAKACLACQKSHLTCDEKRPCTRCLKKGVGDACVEGVRKKAKYLLEGDERDGLQAGRSASPPYTHSQPTIQDNNPTLPQLNPDLSIPNIPPLQTLPTLPSPETSTRPSVPDDIWLSAPLPPEGDDARQIWGDMITGSGGGGGGVGNNGSRMDGDGGGSYPFGPTAAADEFQMLDAMFGNMSPMFPFSEPTPTATSNADDDPFGLNGNLTGGFLDTPWGKDLPMYMDNGGTQQQGMNLGGQSSGILDPQQSQSQPPQPTLQPPQPQPQAQQIQSAQKMNPPQFDSLSSWTHWANTNGNLINNLSSASPVRPRNSVALNPKPLQTPDVGDLMDLDPRPKTAAGDLVGGNNTGETRVIGEGPFSMGSFRAGRGLTPSEVYRNVVKPYDYTEGYHVLMQYLSENFEQKEVLRVVHSLATYRPSLIALQMPMSEEDEIFLERSFQRTLIELEKLISYSATPTAVWRRTGEICYANPEFCKLVQRSEVELFGRKSYIYQLFHKASVITYWENFSVHAFENTTQNFFQPTKLSLANRGGGEQGHVACSACFTIRRDVFDLPSVVIGQFLPIPAE